MLAIVGTLEVENEELDFVVEELGGELMRPGRFVS